ncbi:MotA/TolQ/ExbB proton channel family protein [Cognaticolwellia mytili]|uniref:MotA/TolQ/ExbB proton channel family protein n=1 Tax=Cognaticolwellia mytili TaxID=1888913 RepID=UPI000A173101|nr:MotA/TolQ/ExbB proton channel family protein [Cognaticolwellia mytili]
MIAQIEQTMYQLSDFFMAPVLCLIALLFIYSLFATGQFFSQTMQRRRHYKSFLQLLNSELGSNQALKLNGYPMASLANEVPNISQDQLDVAALKELEGVRNVSRLAPMLGLIATMIPMGPALKSLADGNIQGISENLIVAFSAVIFGLIIASITFWIASIKKRWMVEELVAIMPLLNHQAIKNQQTAESATVTESALPIQTLEKDYEAA